MPDGFVARLAVVARSTEMQCDEIVAFVLRNSRLVGARCLLVTTVSFLVFAFRRVEDLQ